MSEQQTPSFNNSESISEQAKRVLQSKIFIVFFLIPAFVPVSLLIFLPMAFNVLVAIFNNPGLNDIPQWYFSTKNLANIRWGDFFFFISRNDSGGQTGAYLLIILLMFVAFTYIFYRLLNKIKYFNKNRFASFLVAIIISFITPALFDFVYIHIFIALLDIINRFIGNITGQVDFFVLFAPLNNFKLVVNSVQVDFLDILLNTLVWTITCVFFHVTLGIGLALLMNKEFPGRAFFRTIFILPWAIPQFVTALIWRNFIFSYNQGILGKPMYQDYLNKSLNPLSFTILDLFILFLVFVTWALLISAVVSLLKRLRLFKNSRMFMALLVTFIPLLFLMLIIPIIVYSITNFIGITSLFGYQLVNINSYSPNFWNVNFIYIFGRPFNFILFSAIIVNIWLGVPFMMVSFLAALQSIPQDLYEAAKIDGADAFAQFRTITFPLIKPTLFVVSLLGFVWTFNLFNVVYILSQNQTGLSKRNYYDIFVTYIYNFFNVQSKFALAAALSFVVFLLLVGFTWFYRKLLNPDKIFEGDKSTYRS